MKPPVKTSFRGRDVAYLVISIVLVGVGYAAYRGLYFVGGNVPFAQEMILVFLGAAATIYLTAVLLNRQTELELRKEGQVLLFQQKHDTPHSPSKSLILLSGSQYFRYKSWC
ncbi:hypothetical protein [Stenotrophomonas maltophilia]|uniref:hypothetical protein n=1 Tax=Stenotrophomonas maltophilia TaxID=40324 RepID=UPI0021C66ECF|nr:hypothetical protein [Stenotrophomonas maltophilia]